MFSYRHAFHAGSPADVLKHAVLLHVADYLQRKEAPLLAVDTHAGAGAYSLRSDWARQGGESRQGVLHLLHWLGQGDNTRKAPALIRDYADVLKAFDAEVWERLRQDDPSLKPGADLTFYPGSPALLARLLARRPADRLRLFELHRNEAVALAEWTTTSPLPVHRQAMQAGDGFEGLISLLPPPERRALVVMDPSYEDKADYDRVIRSLRDALRRFATGVFVIWHPVLQRLDAQQLPERLQRLGRPWLHARMAVGQRRERGLVASGVFVINPPYTLEPALREALPVLSQVMQQDSQGSWELDVGG
ncbi:23S rRNA (adenine(2030)-N(6))-methyltransferase RlmJ [Amphibiibacter pelophylacis]|uniref:23S rRNA (Adenine(2030)-N(6))-methyltransferase RlmJ n=1 Tax=Amphibiibacter pelophylacis TaxID=1799477 RepID=A0ACC6NYP1_9BURK